MVRNAGIRPSAHGSRIVFVKGFEVDVLSIDNGFMAFEGQRKGDWWRNIL